MKYFRSLRFRIMLMLVLIGIIPTIAASWLITQSYRERAVSIRISNVKNQCDVITRSIISEEYLTGEG